MVYVTEYGGVYHYFPTCHALEFGQRRVEERGGKSAPIETVAEDSAKLDKGPCQQCKPKKKTGSDQ